METISFLAFVTLLRVVLTSAQRVLARVAFDGAQPGEFEGEEREIASELFGPVDEIPSAARSVLVIVKGARVGGTYVFAALYSLWRALTADLSALAPGELAVAVIVAPDTRLGRQALRFALGAAKSVPAIAKRIESVTADSFSICRPDGCVVAIEVLPATRGGASLRGRSLVSAVLSEASFFRDETAAVNDVECFKAVAPRVLPGGLVVLESTPWIEAGLVYEEFTKNFATPRTAMAVHAPTLLMRDDERTRSVVARETERDSDNAMREFGAQFMSGGSGLFFGPELVGPALDRALEPGRRFKGQVSVGGDFGLVTDCSAFVAIEEVDDELIVIDTMEMRPKKGAPLKLSDVVARACEFAAKNGQNTIRVDHHELVAAREHLPSGFSLESCRGGGDAKEDRFLRTREAFRQSRFRIPGKFIKLTTQLGLVVSKPKPGGGTSIILPRRNGTHLDLCAAFVLAVDELTTRADDFEEALRRTSFADIRAVFGRLQGVGDRLWR